MKRKLIDDHKEYFLDNIWAIRMASKEEEMIVARLYYNKGMKESEIAKELKLSVKKVENLMIRMCSRMILHRAYPSQKEKSRENWKELFKKNQSFYNKHKKTFKKELNQKKYKACVLRYEKEKT